MYSKFQLAKKYLHYYFTASNGKGHGIHSPFVFDFVQHVLNDKRSFYAYSQIEYLREQLMKDETVIEVQDLGAGSAISNTKNRTVSDIAKYAAKNKKIARLLFRIADYYQPETMIELGTSLGISSSYLAAACRNAKLFTIEGSASIAEVARKNFQSLGLTNIQLITGNFDNMLSGILQETGKTDLAFIDGNHRKEPTIKYFSQLLDHSSPSSIFIFDDIHWSEEMEQAWEIIKQHNRTTLTIDLFFIGLVFFREDFKTKQHFVIRF
jgi:predicted O-methyltransferase YrrM